MVSQQLHKVFYFLCDTIREPFSGVCLYAFSNHVYKNAFLISEKYVRLHMRGYFHRFISSRKNK